MRSTIRRGKFTDIVTDVAAAMDGLEIDDTALYYRLTEVERPGRQPEITEEVLSGYDVRSHISHLLVLVMEEIEQNGPDEVTIRRTSPYVNYRVRRPVSRQLPLGAEEDEQDSPDVIASPKVSDPGGRQSTTYSKVC